MFTWSVAIKYLILFLLLFCISQQCIEKFILKPVGYWPAQLYKIELWLRNPEQIEISKNNKFDKFIKAKLYLSKSVFPTKYYAIDSMFYGIVTLGLGVLFNLLIR